MKRWTWLSTTVTFSADDGTTGGTTGSATGGAGGPGTDIAPGSVGATSDADDSSDVSHPAGTAGSTGTGIVADETGYGERGQLPDTAAPPIVKSN